MPRGTDGGGPRGDDGPAPYDIPEERLPPGFIETLDNVPATPAVPHPSATVVLMREGGGGPEVLLLRRNRATGFVPGAYVFPGGRVDAADGEDALAERWDGLTREGGGGAAGHRAGRGSAGDRVLRGRAAGGRRGDGAAGRGGRREEAAA